MQIKDIIDRIRIGDTITFPNNHTYQVTGLTVYFGRVGLQVDNGSGIVLTYDTVTHHNGKLLTAGRDSKGRFKKHE